MNSDVSLYDLLGGDHHELLAATTAFYKKVLADELLSPYFSSVDIERQAGMLAEFLAMAFGGPHAYTGRDLRTAHQHLPGLTDAHFDRVLEHLAETLREAGLSEGDVITAGAVAETVRDQVLNR
ncbi:MAG TPA: group 1 truncated hemoglobin [Streptosporangiaceae bacterium]|nr:group 1 truncated hemoglobin [Streptosporangiaceae bacterium]